MIEGITLKTWKTVGPVKIDRVDKKIQFMCPALIMTGWMDSEELIKIICDLVEVRDELTAPPREDDDDPDYYSTFPD